MSFGYRWRKSIRVLALLPALLLLLTGCSGTHPAESGVSEGYGSAGETSPPVTAEQASANDAPGPRGTEPGSTEGTDRMFYAHVNGKVLEITAAENSSADAFLDLLKTGDVTVEMHDYGSFEKVGSLGAALPQNDERITTEPGDVILYQGDQITIYYGVNSWSFTRLGKVQGLTQAELKDILGDGDARVNFSLSDDETGITAN